MSPPPNQIPQSSRANREQKNELPVVPPPEVLPTAATPVASESENTSEATSPNPDEKRRHQPIPPPSEPMQYRAIGLVRGKYTPSDEQFTRGMLSVSDEQAIDSVLLGRVMSLVKNHLDLATEHLWVVYPRTRQQDGNLHLQIVGVWEPENLDKTQQPSDEAAESVEGSPTESAPPPQVAESEPEGSGVEDGYFSIRGEVIFQAQEQEQIVVKIRQTPRNDKEIPKFFKLTLKGVLEKKAVGHFWDFQVHRQAEALVIKQAQDIGIVRPKKPSKPRPQGGRPGGGRGSFRKPQGGGRPPAPPSRPGASSKPTTPEKPIPRPVKRQQQTGGDNKK